MKRNIARRLSHFTIIHLAAFAAPALVAVAAEPAAGEKPPLEVRFYPQAGIRPHEVEARRGISSLLLQNGALVNHGKGEILLESATIEVLEGGRVKSSQALAAGDLEKAAQKGAGLVASGMLQAFDFQFAPDQLLGAGVKLGGSPRLGPGEAIFLGHKYLVYSGAADHLRLGFRGRDAAGKAVEASGELPILAQPSTVDYHFPLAGRWMIAAGATAHSHHRWVAAEEFALDIAQVGEGMRTFRGDGTRRQDYLAYGAPVLAAAAGKVVKVVDGIAETDQFLRRPGEAFAAYNERVAQMQDGIVQQGLDKIPGNVVIVDHGNGEYSMYAHLATGSIEVKEGQEVKQGQPLAKLGTSGNSSEPHLHFQITDRPDPLYAAGIPCRFSNIELPWADWERQLQTGDIVVTH